MRKFLGTALLGVLGWAGATLLLDQDGHQVVSRGLASFASASGLYARPAPTLDMTILEDARKTAGDAELTARYDRLNRDYFGGGLPALPVAWEPRLDDIAATRGDGLVLEGLTDGKAIVINPSLRSNLQALVATLCHEMVHVRLVAGGHAVGEDHGPEFQEQLRRLLDEGAFVGAFATDAEKAELKDSLANELGWLDHESDALRDDAARLDRDRRVIDRDVEDLNARITTANAMQTGWPSDEEQASVKSRLAGINTRSRAHNDRVSAFNRRIDDYNTAIARYNLVSAYPDGLAATRLAPRPVYK
jgi:hypothetical protein